MSKPTKEQWENIEQKLNGYFASVELMIDGYKITLRLGRLKSMRLAIVIYTNGTIDCSARITEETEIHRRFWHPRKKYIHSAKYRKWFNRLGKRRREALCYDDANKTFTYYWPWWTSFKSMKAHFIKNNQSIELVEEKGLDTA